MDTGEKVMSEDEENSLEDESIHEKARQQVLPTQSMKTALIKPHSSFK